MSYPILYSSTETEFSNNGLGILSDAVSCVVTEERNGEYELEMEYPVTGVHYADIALRSLLLARPNPVDAPQPFRVYRISKPMGGIVTIDAQHISYDLSGIPVMPFYAGSAAAAMVQLKNSAAVSSPFDFWTDKSTVAEMVVEVPTSTRAVLGGSRGSVLDVYGGELKFDRFRVSLYNQRGMDRGVSIRYGKNLIDIKQEESCLEVYTGLLPYWADSDGGLVQLPEKTVNAPGSYNFVKILPVDFSSEWQEAPTVEQLREKAADYIKANNIGVPKVSLDVSFVQLEQTQEYRDLALFERVDLCDTVTVEFPAMGVSATAKVNKTIYDVILDRYQSVSLGDTRSSLADAIVQQSEDTQREISDTKSFLQKAVDNATKWLTNGKGVFVFIRDAEGNLTDITCMDVPDIEMAVNVWRWNHGGFGFSSHGYNGPFTTAITQDGHIVADFIDVGTLTASIIKSGVIVSLNKNTIYDLDGGTIQTGTTSGKHVKITDNMIRWYLGTNSFPNGGPTGIFYSVTGSSYIGANSTNTYYGWMPEGTPGTGDANRNGYVGLRITHTDWNATDVAHFNTMKVECGDNFGDSHGYFESYSAKINGSWIGPQAASLMVVNTKQYGDIALTGAGSASPIALDSGSGVLDETGQCYLYLTDEFASTVSTNVTPQWHITPTGETEKPLTLQKDGLYAIVSGKPGTTFDWLCIMPQKGCETLYCEPLDFDMSDGMDRKDYTADAELDNVEDFERNLNDEVLTVLKENNYIEEIWPEQVERRA